MLPSTDVVMAFTSERANYGLRYLCVCARARMWWVKNLGQCLCCALGSIYFVFGDSISHCLGAPRSAWMTKKTPFSAFSKLGFQVLATTLAYLFFPSVNVGCGD